MSVPVGIPPEPPLQHRFYWLALEHHATALGYVCMSFASMEANINYLLESLLDCTPEVRRAVVDASGTSLPTRCELVLKLATLSCPHQDWFEGLETLINKIRNEICPLRNRLVHDVWITTDTGPFQSDQRSFLAKDQSRSPAKITPPKEPERSLQSIWNLTKQIKEVEFHLHLFHSDLMNWQLSGRYEGTHKQFP